MNDTQCCHGWLTDCAPLPPRRFLFARRPRSSLTISPVAAVRILSRFISLLPVIVRPIVHILNAQHLDTLFFHSNS